MRMTPREQKVMRGKILSILEANYPHEMSRAELDAQLDLADFWKGPEATLAEIYTLKDLGYLAWESKPTGEMSPSGAPVVEYHYRLTAAGHQVASGERHDVDNIMWYEPRLR